MLVVLLLLTRHQCLGLVSVDSCHMERVKSWIKYPHWRIINNPLIGIDIPPSKDSHGMGWMTIPIMTSPLNMTMTHISYCRLYIAVVSSWYPLCPLYSLFWWTCPQSAWPNRHLFALSGCGRCSEQEHGPHWGGLGRVRWPHQQWVASGTDWDGIQEFGTN